VQKPTLRPPLANDPPPLFDPNIVAPLEACMAPERLASHHARLAVDIEALLGLLADGAAETTELEAITHKIAGDSGLLGFMALAATARQFLGVLDGNDAASHPLAMTLEDVAGRSLAVLRQRLESSRSAAAASATLA
jgi:HPt (histidine-containing phosphotransfer) domain-containing protein